MPYKDPQKRREMQARIRVSKGKNSILRGSSRHVALGYLKMSKTPVTLVELSKFNNAMFGRRGKEILKSLVDRGFAQETLKGYIATREGVAALYQIPIKYPRQAVSDL